MGLLDGKNALVFGLANDRSIAWGITQTLHREGAKIGISYAGGTLKRRVMPLAEQIDCKWVEEWFVANDEHIAATAGKAGVYFGKIDVLVHSIAYSGREELTGPFYNTSCDGFKNAMDISFFLVRGAGEGFSADAKPRRVADVYDLIRVGESCAALQRDGLGQRRAGSVDALPGL